LVDKEWSRMCEELVADWFLGMGWDWVYLVLRPLFGLLHQPRMVDNECGAVGGMSGRWNWRTRRKPAPVPLCPPQILQHLIWHRPQVSEVGSRWLTTWAMARLGSGLTRSNDYWLELCFVLLRKKKENRVWEDSFHTEISTQNSCSWLRLSVDKLLG
jgi:hypothetical protein